MKGLVAFLAWVALIAGLVPSSAQGQTPYLTTKSDAAWLSLGAGLSLAGHVQGWRTDLPSYPNLDPGRIPAFDRFSAGWWNENAQLWSHASVGAAGVGAATLLASKPVREDLLTIAIMGAEAFLLSDGVVSLAKPMVLRPRPFLYGNAAPADELAQPDAYFSFFSAHTTYAATFSFFTAKVLHDTYPGAKWRKWVWAGAAAIPLAAGAFRVYGGKHFVSDVVAGYAVGALAGVLVPELHLRRKAAVGAWRYRSTIFVQGNGLGVVVHF